ncbi:MAG: SDR family oxidoreductase [Acidimicrobiales bacterium]|nr:SDR family oxidoreductase [Acidimicrobiales bacterium]
MTIAVVTGSNSGIGRATAVELAARGWTVYGTMRNLDKGTKLAAMAEAVGVSVHPIVCDVTDTASVQAACAEVLDAAGRIDVLVNNAGVGSNGTVEETPIEAYEQVMDANLLGVVRWVQAAAPAMRAQGSGCIVNVSSVAGRIGAIGQAAYVASKWALEGLSEELALELAPQGIRVVILEPGIVKTAIMAKNQDAPNATGAYEAANRRMFAMYAAGLTSPGDPADVAAVIHEAVTTDEPKLRWSCGWGGPELTTRRAEITDEAWVELGTFEDDAEYAARFQELFGLDVAPGFELLG